MRSLGVSLHLLLGSVFLEGAVLAAGAAILCAPRLAARYRTSRLVAVLALGSLAGILLLTAPVVRPGALLHLGELWNTARALTWPAHGLTDLRLLDLGVEGWSNVLLYVPASALWSAMTGRRWRVAVAFTGCSFLIESLQAGLLVRVADPQDLYANALGAVIGIGCSALIADLRRPSAAPWWLRRGFEPRRARRGVVVLGLIGALLLSADGLLDRLADQDQARLLESVRRAYGVTTADDVLDAAARDGYSSFASRAGVPADYLGAVTPDVVQARFSTAALRGRAASWSPGPGRGLLRSRRRPVPPVSCSRRSGSWFRSTGPTAAVRSHAAVRRRIAEERPAA